MGDKIVVLDKGIIQQVGTADEIYNNPKNDFVAGFIGQMNFFESEVKNNRITIEGIEFDLPKDFNKEILKIGIRAEKMLSGNSVVTVNTDIVEMTGGEKNVYLDINGSKCVAKIPLDYIFDKKINLKLDVKNLYFFDSKTGENLLCK